MKSQVVLQVRGNTLKPAAGIPCTTIIDQNDDGTTTVRLPNGSVTIKVDDDGVIQIHTGSEVVKITDCIFPSGSDPVRGKFFHVQSA